MKTMNYLKTWALSALGVAVVTLPTFAADQSTQSTRRQSRESYSSQTTSSSSQNQQGLGQLERANKLVGKEVLSSDNQKLGKIDNIITDLESGRILYAVVGSGGVAGVGEKKRAVPPGIFEEGTGNNLRLNTDKAKFDSAPEFTKDIDKAVELGKAQFVNQVYQAFGQSAWWQGGAGTSASTGEFHNVHKATDLIGMNVKNVSDQSMGKVDNVMLNLPQGRIAYIILDPDRSLALGSDLYALPPNAFSMNADGKSLTSDISKDKLAAAPHFAKNNWAQLSDTSFASQVYQYYGKQAYFETGTSNIKPTGRTSSGTPPQ